MECAKVKNHIGLSQAILAKCGPNNATAKIVFLLTEICSDGSLALCRWQIVDRIRLRQCLSPCGDHLLNTLLNMRHGNTSIR